MSAKATRKIDGGCLGIYYHNEDDTHFHELTADQAYACWLAIRPKTERSRSLTEKECFSAWKMQKRGQSIEQIALKFGVSKQAAESGIGRAKSGRYNKQ